jgi:solute:Na+ symporter, SSS family
MHIIDWLVLIITLGIIICYGLYKSKASKNLEGYFLSDRSLPWYLVLLSIMGTQASAITFISAPGQSFTDGMRFVQYYFGLPLAMIAIVYTLMPIFVGKKLFTPYSWLETRFDGKTRLLTSFIFLLQRGLSTGISIYAPALILSTLLDWNIYLTNIVMGGLLIIYTVYGGAKAVAYTQQLQLIIILTGMFIAGYIALYKLPAGIGFTQAIDTATVAGKMNIFTSGFTKNGFDWKDKYNVISGIIGGFFLAFSYFGTDHSQVGRLLTSKNVAESRKGLLMNGIVKIPMQLAILFVGILVFAFYQYTPHQISFNKNTMAYVAKTNDSALVQMNRSYQQSFSNQTATQVIQRDSLRKAFGARLKTLQQKDIAEDTNHIFLSFVVKYLPVGLVGLLIAVIFLAAWGSISAALNSLASCTVIDFVQVLQRKKTTDATAYNQSKWITFIWGIFSIIIAMFAGQMGSLIEAVNMLGSWFYGTVLGIFLVGLWMPRVKGNHVFIAALIVQTSIIVATFIPQVTIGFLWYNVIGCLGLMTLALILSYFSTTPRNVNVA